MVLAKSPQWTDGMEHITLDGDGSRNGRFLFPHILFAVIGFKDSLSMKIQIKN